MEATINICDMYGDNTIEESMARKWFSHFKEDYFEICDTPLSERHLGFDDHHLNIGY